MERQRARCTELAEVVRDEAERYKVDRLAEIDEQEKLERAGTREQPDLFRETTTNWKARRAEGDDEKLRKSVVREAFNSPFWPFVLATTSVGQEGLDVHLYCRDVLHWNMPSNPVDLEQREGRVNRRDCLAIRESIAKDWPLRNPQFNSNEITLQRNPWPRLFDLIEKRDDLQNYKHGLFPHWVYECRDPRDTVRIRRHVPFFVTSRDASRYEGLKERLVLYRLVFGQVDQEDLLEHLQQQTQSHDLATKDGRIKRLASYMLNLSPIGHKVALQYALAESKLLCAGSSDHLDLRRLLTMCKQILLERPIELAEVKNQIEQLIDLVERAIESGNIRGGTIRRAVAALAYLRNPYDHIFDLHSEGGFVDDIDEIQKTWSIVAQRENNQESEGMRLGSAGQTRGAESAALRTAQD